MPNVIEELLRGPQAWPGCLQQLQQSQEMIYADIDAFTKLEMNGPSLDEFLKDPSNPF